jgi:sugar O-acyltransferase (sialic acid O-acetyltransferase NeuD family)
MLKQEQIVLLGGGGHAKVLIDLIRTVGQFKIEGILDPVKKAGSSIFDVEVIGNDDILSELYQKGIRNACIAVGSIKDNSTRKMLFQKAKQIGFFIPSLIHLKAVISYKTNISEGVQVMAGAIVQAETQIKENTLINSGVIIEHDCYLGRHIHISSGAVLSGGVSVGDGSFIGAGSTILQGIKIGNNVIVGAGAVVIKDVPDGLTVKGVPAK